MRMHACMYAWHACQEAMAWCSQHYRLNPFEHVKLHEAAEQGSNFEHFVRTNEPNRSILKFPRHVHYILHAIITCGGFVS